ncbi:SDR family NAD(P)-dependent oxidoreductase [Halomarina ordinaria]|uniref:SDR family NAD(P)-dependent oxidoreductase n=1 Tax=Halomarina ordinaria TaxID=3033939 RepID=A0ABD5UEC8_9EURY|nr:SDR family NAD(P)-dependent oxidoreductase [Halomarina sp. PSRA2]
MEIDLSGRTAVVTGASAGIGRAIATSLAEAGGNVVVADIERSTPPDADRTTVEHIRAISGEAHFIEVDVADGESVAAMIRTAVDRYGGLDVLVNNAGISHKGTIEETAPTEWQRVIDVNLTGVYNGVHHAVEYLRKSPAPRILNIASQLAFVAQPRKPAYIASKGGVVSLTKSLALDYAHVPILVNAICPGVVETELTREVLADEQRRRELESWTSLPYLGQPEDIGSMATFLASDYARFVTGQQFIVDGGYVIK